MEFAVARDKVRCWQHDGLLSMVNVGANLSRTLEPP
jgi:hypothetical protein